MAFTRDCRVNVWWLWGVVAMMPTVLLSSATGCEFTLEDVDADLMQLTCKCDQPPDDMAMLQSLSVNWYPGFKKTNLLWLEYYHGEGARITQDKYAHGFNVTRKTFTSDLKTIDLQLRMNVTDLSIQRHFECVIRGFDARDNHKTKVLDYSPTTTTPTTTTTTTTPTPATTATTTTLKSSTSTATTQTTETSSPSPPAAPAKSPRTPPIQNVNVRGMHNSWSDDTDLKAPAAVSQATGSDVTVVALVTAFTILIIIVGIVVFMIARRRSSGKRYGDDTPPPYGPPTEGYAWDVMRQLLNFVTSTNGRPTAPPAAQCGPHWHAPITCRSPSNTLPLASPYAVSSVLTPSQSMDSNPLLSDAGCELVFENGRLRMYGTSSEDGDSEADKRDEYSGTESETYLKLAPPLPTTVPTPGGRTPIYNPPAGGSNRQLRRTTSESIPPARSSAPASASRQPARISRRLRNALAYAGSEVRPAGTTQSKAVRSLSHLPVGSFGVDDAAYLTPMMRAAGAQFTFDEESQAA